MYQINLKNIPVSLDILPEYSIRIFEIYVENKEYFISHSKFFNNEFEYRIHNLIQEVTYIIENKTFVNERLILTHKFHSLLSKLERLYNESNKYFDLIEKNLLNFNKIEKAAIENNYNYIFSELDKFQKIFNTQSKILRENNLPGILYYELEETINQLASNKLMLFSLDQTPIELLPNDIVQINTLWQLTETTALAGKIIFKNNTKKINLLDHNNIMNLLNENRLNKFLHKKNHKMIS